MSRRLIHWTPFVVALLMISQVALAQVENLLENPNFEVAEPIPGPSWATWNPAEGAGSTAAIDLSDSVDGSGSCRIDGQGSDNWHFYVINGGIPMEVGETYTLSFWAKAAAPRSIGVLLKGEDNSGPEFCSINPELTAEWTEYHVTDVCTQPECKLDIASGGSISVWLDFMHLYKGQYDADIQPSGRTEPQQVENLLKNPNFDVDEPIPGPSWDTWNPAEGDGSTATIDLSDSIDGLGSCRIDPRGSDNWHFYVISRGIPMEVGETYTLSFWAKAAAPRSIGVLLKGNDNSGPAFCSIDAGLTTEWSEYHVTDVCTQPECKLDIASGGSISVWLDFMYLYKGEYVPGIRPSGAGEPEEPQQDTNLLRNGNFEVIEPVPGPSWNTWVPAEGAGSSAAMLASDSVDGMASLRLDPRGTSRWHFYVIQNNIPMEIGKTYTLSFWARAEEPRGISLLLKPNDNSEGTWCAISPELTTEWTEYTVTDTVPDDAGSPIAKLDISSGDSEAPVWLDFMHLYEGEYVEILPGGRQVATEDASNPNPVSGAGDVPHNAILTWIPGLDAVTNDVYLGASFDDVNNADANSVLLVSPAQDANSYEPSLDFATTYFWRVDAVSDTGEIVKGMVWSFTTRDYIGIDDFESYTNEVGSRAFEVWIDGVGFTQPEPGHPGNLTGASVGHDIWSDPTPYTTIMETTIARGGKSMPLYYDNNKQGYANYSETTKIFGTPQDWTANGIKALALCVYGSASNSGSLYIKINDTKIPYAGPGDSLQDEYWIQMYIDLAAVPVGLDLTNVTSLTIGIEGANANGMLYLDDIRLLIQVLGIPALGADKPVIDGQIDALWDAVQAYPIDTLRTGAELESEFDCSGTMQILWDTENLYILVEVNDEALVQDSANGWEDDRIEIFIDADGSKTTGGPGFQGTDGVNDYQYCFSWKPDAVAPVEWYFNDDPARDSMAGVESGVAVTEGGYRIEVELPWSTLLGAVPSAGNYMGIALAVDDDDDGGAMDSQVTSLMSGAGSPHVPTLWATVQLIE